MKGIALIGRVHCETQSRAKCQPSFMLLAKSFTGQQSFLIRKPTVVLTVGFLVVGAMGTMAMGKS